MEKVNTLSKIKLSINRIRQYVITNCFNDGESVAECSVRLGIPIGLIYKVWNRQPITLKSLVSIIYAAGKWNDETCRYVMNAFREVFMPQSDDFFELKFYRNSPGRNSFSTAYVFRELHRLSGKSQLDVSVETGYSRSFIQNIVSGRGCQSEEALLALFFYYYEAGCNNLTSPSIKLTYLANIWYELNYLHHNL